MAKPFSCVQCGEKAPFFRALTLSNFSKIKCKQCHTVLKPRRKETSTVGGIVGGVSGGLVFLVVYNTIKRTNFQIGILVGLVVAAIIFLITAFISYRVIPLEKADR